MYWGDRPLPRPLPPLTRGEGCLAGTHCHYQPNSSQTDAKAILTSHDQTRLPSPRVSGGRGRGRGPLMSDLTFDRSVPGHQGVRLPDLDVPEAALPDGALLRDGVRLPEMSQLEVLR